MLVVNMPPAPAPAGPPPTAPAAPAAMRHAQPHRRVRYNSRSLPLRRSRGGLAEVIERYNRANGQWQPQPHAQPLPPTPPQQPRVTYHQHAETLGRPFFRPSREQLNPATAPYVPRLPPPPPSQQLVGSFNALPFPYDPAVTAAFVAGYNAGSIGRSGGAALPLFPSAATGAVPPPPPSAVSRRGGYGGGRGGYGGSLGRMGYGG
jgi:hypothetical protein